MQILARLFLVALLFPLMPASAQVGSVIDNALGGQVNIVLEPLYPNPGEQVTATIDDYALSNTGATISWFFDGLSAPAIENNRSILFTAPPVGTTLTVEARLRFNDGRSLATKKSVTPYYLDLIIEPQTYTPFFYQGRALPTKGSLVNINALLQDKNGLIDSSQYSYTWTLNNTSLYGGSRIGGNWAQITVPHGQSNTITISIQNKVGTTVARKLVSIPTVPMEIQFYEVSTLLGLSKKTVPTSLILTGNSTSIKAVPYYLDTRAVQGNLYTQWSINNTPVQPGSNDPFEINLQKGTAGLAQVSFKVRNLNELLQSDEAMFGVTF
jgi:hypothetical protein